MYRTLFNPVASGCCQATILLQLYHNLCVEIPHSPVFAWQQWQLLSSTDQVAVHHDGVAGVQLQQQQPWITSVTGNVPEHHKQQIVAVFAQRVRAAIKLHLGVTAVR
jgi:hypothetical protein